VTSTIPVRERFAPLFEPKAVAVVGASAKGGALPNVFIRRMREFGYAGAIYPIHPSAETIDGLPAYRSLAQTPLPIDYAYVAVAAAQVPGILAAAGGRVRFAQVIASGFGEIESGKALEQQLVEGARTGGCRLIGPNCLGVYSPRGGMNFAEIGSKTPGPVGIVSQSGGFGTDIIRRGMWRGVGFSGLVTVGNCADVGPAELVEYYLADPETRVIGVYIESAKDGRRLFELLRAARAAKPVVILKGGRTGYGVAAAASHTGSLAGDDRAWVALARQTGAVLVDTLDAFIDALLIFQTIAPRAGTPTRRVVLFGNGGGSSVVATDVLARLGFAVEPLAGPAAAALGAMELLPGTSIVNPVDVPVGTLQQEDGQVAERMLDAIHADAGAEALLMHLNIAVLVGRTKRELMDNLIEGALRAQARHAGRMHFALVLRSDGEPEIEARKREFRARAVELGVPVFDETPAAAAALAALAAHERFLARGRA